MNIKQASEQSGVSAPNIRFYEKEGLLTPARRQGNDYRDYTAGDVRTLKLIRMLRMLDVPLPTIKAVLRGEQPLQQALQAQLDKLRGSLQDDPLSLPWVKELLASGQLAELDRPTVAAAIREIRVYEGNRMEIDYLLPEGCRALLEG